MRAFAVGLCVAASGLLGLARDVAALSPDRPLGACSVRRWLVRDGLPGDSIRALAQGRDGTLWIAAWGGIARYDGVELGRIEAAAALRPAAGDVTDLLTLPDGTVWAGSANHPPLAITRDQVRALAPGTGLPPGTAALAFAEGPGGIVTAASAGAVYRWADGRFSLQPLRDLGERRVRVLALDARGTLWLGTDRGLLSVAGTDLIVRPDIPETAAVDALFVDRRQVLWVAGAGALWAIDGERVTRWGSERGLPAATVSGIADDEDGHLWAATSAGLVRVSDDGALTVFGTKDGLPETDLTAILVDREGSLWIGTRTGGLAQFSDRTLDTHAVPSELAGQELSVLGEDGEHGLWFGTLGAGVLRWKDGRGVRYRRAQGLPDDRVTALLPDRTGARPAGAKPAGTKPAGTGGAPSEPAGAPDAGMWIGTEAGLVRWSKGMLVDPGIWSRPVSALYRDDGGNLWIGGHGELGRLPAGATRVERFGAEAGVPARRVRALAQDGDGDLWVSGIGRPPIGRLEGARFDRPPPFRDRRIGPVRSMLLDRTGTFWLTVTSVGLVGVRGDRTWVFDARAGFDVNGLYQLAEDDAGDLWIGTSKSILRVTRSSLDATAEGRRPAPEVVSFESTDRGAGVVASELKASSTLRDHTGRLWFVTAQGAVTIDPRGVRSNPVPPAILIRGVTVDGRPVDARSAEGWPARFTRLELAYAAVTLLEPGKVRYRYRLEGKDGSWISAGARRMATYGDLSPGRYRFRVMAANNDGRWHEGPRLAFVVGAPFYLRPWFLLACGLGLLPLGFAVHRERMARLRARYTGIAAERSRVARELHDTLLQGMSGIAMHLDALCTRLPQDLAEPRRELETLGHEVRECLEEARKVVWNLRDGEASHGDLGPTLARFARRLTSSTPTTCEVHIDGTPRHVAETLENHVFRVAQEALVNAIKHAQARHIDVWLRYADAELVLEIQDDGKGFDPATTVPAPTGHFGLLGMHERTAALGAQLTIDSRPGHGTRITLKVPLARA